MFTLKRIWCRTVQAAFRAALPLLPYREPQVLTSCDRLFSLLSESAARSALIVTSAGSARRGQLDPAVAALTAAGVRYTVYDRVQPDPTVENVEEGLALYRAEGCDLLLAIGGGSAIDCAKAIGARVAYPQKPIERLSGVMRVRRRIPTLIAIPTTAGTGSEVTLAAVIKDAAAKSKYALMSFPLIPHYAVLDPTLTVTMPPYLTATTGMDALTHAVEAYIGRSTTKRTRRLAEEATALIFKHLPQAYRDGGDLIARENMLNASYRAGAAFSVSYVGYVHAIAHSLGGAYGVPHGLANAVILPQVLEAYGKSAHKKLHRLGVAAGVSTEADPPAVGAEKFIAAVRALNESLHIPATIPELATEDIPALAAHAAREANPLYPVPRLMNARELAALYGKIATKS